MARENRAHVAQDRDPGGCLDPRCGRGGWWRYGCTFVEQDPGGRQGPAAIHVRHRRTHRRSVRAAPIVYSLEVPEQFSADATRLAYRSARSSWEITRDRIFCVGEATSESPVEDWLLCVVTDVQGNWVEASLYAQGRNDAVQWLSQALGSSLELKLANAPPFRSRVMWPPPLQESPLFEYQVSLFRRVFSRSLRRLGIPLRNSVQSVHSQVMDSLWRAHRQTASRSG